MATPAPAAAAPPAAAAAPAAAKPPAAAPPAAAAPAAAAPAAAAPPPAAGGAAPPPGAAGAPRDNEPPMPLNIEPEGKVIFKGAPDAKGLVYEMKITNPTKSRHCFKVKCTSNDVFRVRPPLGFLNAGETIPLSISFIGKDIPPSGKHFFAFYTTSCKDDDKNVRAVWTPTAKPEGVKRIPCDFVKEDGTPHGGAAPAAPPPAAAGGKSVAGAPPPPVAAAPPPAAAAAPPPAVAAKPPPAVAAAPPPAAAPAK
uniref:Major sperm protein n=1 Tax=Panagrellus redivivus TaxID=6233 RepID=A0A7E4V554_PANRE